MSNRNPFSFRPVFSQIHQVSRFSDCGHTKSGEFDHGNTCGSLGGSGGSHSRSHIEQASHIAKNYKNMDYRELNEEIDKLESFKPSEAKEAAKYLEDTEGFPIDSKASKPKIVAQIRKMMMTLYTDHHRVQGIINQ